MTNTPHPLDVAIGIRIRARRTELKLSQTALANAIGLTFQQVQKYEWGSNRISFSRLVDTAHALDCRVADLIDDLDGGAARPEFRRQTRHLRVEGAQELLAAYSELPIQVRKLVLTLARGIAEDQPAVRHD
jgi:transcriptional regulator with XRE-family HTH domain